jgi:hypothetical protein
MKDPAFIIKWYALHDGRGDEMRKKVGNAFWNYHHLLAEWTKPENGPQIKAFETLKSGVESFPCPQCSEGGQKYLASHPFHPDTESMKDYVWNFHNAINDHLGKPKFTMPKDTHARNCVPKNIITELIGNIDDPAMIQQLKEIVSCEV